MRLVTIPPAAPYSPITTVDFASLSSAPPYAILSHTWESDEVSLQELQAPALTTHNKGGFLKIQQTCSLAQSRDALQHAWVDTCCIDKTSSAELAEAINSMFAWYAQAEICYVYLADLEPSDTPLDEALPKCRWFTRGWTLQELIAPTKVVFFDRAWRERGNKHELSELLARITGIPAELLRHETELASYAAARRMSWAAMRETTRVEDMTYCLLGIFDVNLSLIYGEGGKKAFYRLQEAIATDTSDLSIFVWTDDRPTCPDFAPVLAESPRQFASSGNITVALEDSIYRDLTVTSRGIQVESSLLWFADHPDHAYRSVLDVFCRLGNESIGICIRKIGGGRYARHKPGMLAILGDKLQHRPWLDAHRLLVESLTLAPKLPSSYPFHSGNNPILGNRHLVLRLHWEPSSTRDWSVHHCRTMPRSHWDKHEDVFFAANSTTKGWAAFFVHGVLRNTPTTYIPVNLFLACFQWNIGPPNTVIAGLHDVEPSTAVLLESQLDRIRFESNRQARAMVHSVFDGKLKDRTAVLETAVIPIEGGNPQSPVLVSEWHSKSLHVGEKVNVEVTVDIGHEVCPELCVNPVIQLNVRVAVVK